VDPYVESNRALWNEWTKIHGSSEFYDLEGFKRGGVRLRLYEMEEVGDVAGKTLLHLQCHFGIDTLSWARLGANVTGVDFAEEAVELAREVAQEIEVPAEFIRSNVYDLPGVLDRIFDVVYTSRGVLGWLPDIRRWAEVVGRFVAPGGLFYITEVHPFLQILEDDLSIAYGYWEDERPLAFDVQGSYADRNAVVSVPKEYGWNHALGEIVTALVDAGLTIELLHEWPFLDWELPFLEPREDGLWRLQGELDGRLPLMFSMRARKPAERARAPG
jgi:ubiquinone/menaquinone biosynthesis C-methylase UbiE